MQASLSWVRERKREPGRIQATCVTLLHGWRQKLPRLSWKTCGIDALLILAWPLKPCNFWCHSGNNVMFTWLEFDQASLFLPGEGSLGTIEAAKYTQMTYFMSYRSRAWTYNVWEICAMNEWNLILKTLYTNGHYSGHLANLPFWHVTKFNSSSNTRLILNIPHCNYLLLILETIWCFFGHV